jgi:hypothetical protein
MVVRSEIRKQLLEAIISIQNGTLVVQGEKTNMLNNNNNKPKGGHQIHDQELCSSAEQIRQACESLTRPYRLFAKHLALTSVPIMKSTTPIDLKRVQ